MAGGGGGGEQSIGFENNSFDTHSEGCTRCPLGLLARGTVESSLSSPSAYIRPLCSECSWAAPECVPALCHPSLRGQVTESSAGPSTTQS